MDPANPNVGGIINPGPASGDFQGSTPQNEPVNAGMSSDFPQNPVNQQNPVIPQTPEPVAPVIPQFPTVESPIISTPSVPPVVNPQTPTFPSETPGTPTPPPTSGGNKKALLLGIVGVLLLGTIGGGIYLASRYAPRLAQQTQPVAIATATPSPAVASAKVAYLEGSAKSMLGDVSSVLVEGQSVPEGATIEAEEDAKVLLTFTGGSILRIGPASKVTLSSLDQESMSFKEESGIIYVYVDGTGKGTFKVEAGEVTVEAVGTAFSVEKDELALVNVYESKIKVTEGEEVLEVAEKKQFIEGVSTKATLVASDLEADDFLQWSLEEELQRIDKELISQTVSTGSIESKEAYKTALEDLGIDKKVDIKQTFLTSKTGEVGRITLTGKKTSEGAVALSWDADGLAENGFRILWSGTPGMLYPGDKKTFEPIFAYAKTLGPMGSGKTWYYRVCEWTGVTCGVYSNELSFSF